MDYQLGQQAGRQTQVDASYGASAQDTTTPGKQTLVQQQVYDPHQLVIEAVRSLANQQLTDGGNFQYLIQPDATFLIIGAPDQFQHCIGAVIGTTHAAWPILADLALNSGQCTETDGMSIGQPAPSAPAAPAPAPAPKTPKAPRGPLVLPPHVHADPTPDGDVQLRYDAVPLAVGDVAMTTNEAKSILPPDELEKKSQTTIQDGTWVRVLEIHSNGPNDKGLARVVKLSGPDAPDGKETFRVRAAKLQRVPRPPRKTTPEGQMNALVQAAEAAHDRSHLRCFRYVKNYIVLAGGYGDILDIHADPRFAGYQSVGLDFHRAASQYLDDLWLERIDGKDGSDIARQTPGTILVTIGNGKDKSKQAPNGISNDQGDVAVIAGLEGKFVRCINDGVMHLPADPGEYAPGKDFENTIVAMYKPRARP